MSFKILNSIILLGHSYDIITAYDKQRESANQEENTASSTNENVPLKKSASFSDKLPSESNHVADVTKHRGSHDLGVLRSESHVYFANSFCDLTMVPNNTVIEASPHRKIPRSLNSSTKSVSEHKIIESENSFDIEEVSYSYPLKHKADSQIGESVRDFDDGGKLDNSLHQNVVSHDGSHDGSGDSCNSAGSCLESHVLPYSDSDVTLRQRYTENQCSTEDIPSSKHNPETVGTLVNENSCSDVNHDLHDGHSIEKTE